MSVAKSNTFRRLVLRAFPQAYCRRLNDRTGYIVWPSPVGPRGTVTAAIGIGRSAVTAWRNASQNEKVEAPK
jgi:hypothetical protein